MTDEEKLEHAAALIALRSEIDSAPRCSAPSLSQTRTAYSDGWDEK
jgi:hypothetical protein